MNFTDRLTEGNIAIIEVTGKIMGGGECTLFHGKIHEYIREETKNFIIDLNGVDWMNDVGLGMLISALTTVKNSGGRLVLCHIAKVESILTITRLITVFEHYDNVDDAEESFC